MDNNKKTEQSMLSELTDSASDDWKTLAASIEANYSLHPGWTAVTATSHDIADRSILLMTYQDKEAVCAFPITLSSTPFFGLKLRTVDLVSNRVSYHNNLVTSLDPATSVKILIEEASNRNADVVSLAGIPDDSELGMHLKSNHRQSLYRMHQIPGETSPYLPLQSSWDELLANKPKKFRYKARKRAESLDTSDNLRMQWFDHDMDCPQLLDVMRIVEENSWKKEAGISLFERDSEHRYHAGLLPFLCSQKAMFANVLFHDDVPIAYNLCCVWNGWVGQMKTSFDTRFSELSPGSLVIDYAIRHSLELGATEFDFLGDTDPHKLAWTKSARSHTHYFLYLRSSLKGNLVGKVKDLRNRFAA